MDKELERMKSRLNRKILKFEKDKSDGKDEADLIKNKKGSKKNEPKVNDGKLSKELENPKINEVKNKELEKELANTKEALEEAKKKTKKYEKYEKAEKEKLEAEKKAKAEEKRKKDEEEFGPLGIGIYDRRSITKELRKKQYQEENETLEKAYNPPAEVLSVRYQKLLRELLYALLFTIIIGTFHLLMFKEIKYPKIAAKGTVIALSLVGIFFFERSYRKDLDMKLFIRGIEFTFVSGFLMYFTEARYISSRLVTLILPIISIALIFYYIAKVLIIEVIERNKYITSLSDAKKIIDLDRKASETGMLYRNNVNNKKLTYLLNVMNERDKKAKPKEASNIEIDASNPYKKEKRTKKEQENFEKWKAKIKS